MGGHGLNAWYLYLLALFVLGLGCGVGFGLVWFIYQTSKPAKPPVELVVKL